MTDIPFGAEAPPPERGTWLHRLGQHAWLVTLMISIVGGAWALGPKLIGVVEYDGRIADHTHRLDRIDARLDAMEHRQFDVEKAVTQIATNVQNLHDLLETMKAARDQQMNRIAQQLDNLEARDEQRFQTVLGILQRR